VKSLGGYNVREHEKTCDEQQRWFLKHWYPPWRHTLIRQTVTATMPVSVMLDSNVT